MLTTQLHRLYINHINNMNQELVNSLTHTHPFLLKSGSNTGEFYNLYYKRNFIENLVLLEDGGLKISVTNFRVITSDKNWLQCS